MSQTHKTRLRAIVLPALSATAITMTAIAPAFAGDARSIALGGSVVANGQGVQGALENPASMMAMKRRDETVHFRFGASAEIRDTGSAIDTLRNESNQNLISDLETEIDTLSGRELQCDPLFGNADDVCIDGTQSLADLSAQLLDLLNTVDDETIDGQIHGDLGLAFTQYKVPFAIHLKVSATGAGRPDIADQDRSYIQEFENLLDNDTLTLEEIRNSQFLQADALGIPIGVTQPEDVLQSEGSGSALLRTQLGISFASTFKLGAIEVDAGVTPKFSSLKAYNINVSVVDEFLDNSVPVADRFEDSEVTESSFTFDAGGSLALPKFPVRLAAVLKNVAPETIKTDDGFKFETTPQLIIGALFQRGKLSVSGDMALNSAKIDNFETQKIGVGVEFGTRKFSIRGGLSHDAARSKDNTALSLGFGLGPVQVGGRLSGTESLEAGMSLAYSFK